MMDWFKDLPLVFETPHWLWLLVIAPVLLVLRGQSGRTSSVLYPSAGLVLGVSRKVHRRWGGVPGLLHLIKILSLCLLVVALARPKWRKGSVTESERSGVDIVLGLDLSGSMWAHDFEVRNKPTDRLSVVKKVIEEFIRERPDDRIGIVAFSGAPYLVSPLTLNHDWVLENLDRLRIGSIPEQGTAIGSAIGMAVNRLNKQKSDSRLIVLLTDGANNAGQIEPVQAAEAAASFKIKIYTIGAGQEGVVPFPLINRDGTPRRDARGNMLMGRSDSDIDLETLQKVAELTGGKSYHAEDATALNKVYEDIDKLEKTEKKLKIRHNYKEVFAFPLIFGLGLFLLEQTLSGTRFRRLP
ncbi:MAG: VWA domain-containing protein [Opitutae bacterium]